MAYYGLDEAIMSDGDFDKLCNFCADNWQDLHPDRKFALGTAEQIRTSGFHVRVSFVAELSCIRRLTEMGRMDGRTIRFTGQRRASKSVGRWLPCTSYSWG
jgi:hypothetical protein